MIEREKLEEIKPKMVDGEPVCGDEICPMHDENAYSMSPNRCKYIGEISEDLPCIPALRQQRDAAEARAEKAEKWVPHVGGRIAHREMEQSRDHWWKRALELEGEVDRLREELDNHIQSTVRSRGQLVRNIGAAEALEERAEDARDAAQARVRELETLLDQKDRCDCSDDEACRHVRERDAARQEALRLREERNAYKTGVIEASQHLAKALARVRELEVDA